jgi:hypothetical protein
MTEFEEGNFLSLFDSEITGSVRDPFSGKIYGRKRIIDFYKTLLFISAKLHDKSRPAMMLEMIREFLEIPEDIHDELVAEAFINSEMGEDLKPEAELTRDFASSLNIWQGVHRQRQLQLKEMFEEFKTRRDPGLESMDDVLVQRDTLMEKIKENDMSVMGESIYGSGGSLLRRFKDRHIIP